MKKNNNYNMANKIIKRATEKLSDPYLIEKIENYKNSFGGMILNKIPIIKEALEVHSKAQQETRLTIIEDDLEYIQEKLEKILERDEQFIKSPEFGKFVSEIMNHIKQSSDKQVRRVYSNLLINGMTKKDEISNKIMFLNTLNNLTTNHVFVLSFFMDPLLFCKNNNLWPQDSSRSCPMKTIIEEIFTEYDFDMIHQSIIDLARYGIINDHQIHLNNAVNTMFGGTYPTSPGNPSESRNIQEALRRFSGWMTDYGNKFTRFLIIGSK